jgi:ketosteroid isomerase-like protein
MILLFHMITFASFYTLLLSCTSNSSPSSLSAMNAKEDTATVATLEKILKEFNNHDLDAIMEYFTEDCTFELPRGPEPWGQRFNGKAEVREGLATRFKGLPDVQYTNDRHFVSGNRGASEWLLTGTTTAGVRIEVQGCDLWEFTDGKVSRKDSYWKIVER